MGRSEARGRGILPIPRTRKPPLDAHGAGGPMSQGTAEQRVTQSSAPACLKVLPVHPIWTICWHTKPKMWYCKKRGGVSWHSRVQQETVLANVKTDTRRAGQ